VLRSIHPEEELVEGWAGLEDGLPGQRTIRDGARHGTGSSGQGGAAHPAIRTGEQGGIPSVKSSPSA
jgi:hypothetical protein